MLGATYSKFSKKGVELQVISLTHIHMVSNCNMINKLLHNDNRSILTQCCYLYDYFTRSDIPFLMTRVVIML